MDRNCKNDLSFINFLWGEGRKNTFFTALMVFGKKKVICQTLVNYMERKLHLSDALNGLRNY